jgi:kinesin family protein 2/24
LAGSERYEDSKDHDKQRMEEARDNNKSLMNLKECVRAKAKMAAEDGFVHIPWRSNKLTMLLKVRAVLQLANVFGAQCSVQPIFDIESRQPSKALIIAHVSPHIQDSVHSYVFLPYSPSARQRLVGPTPYPTPHPSRPSPPSRAALRRTTLKIPAHGTTPRPSSGSPRNSPSAR